MHNIDKAKQYKTYEADYPSENSANGSDSHPGTPFKKGCPASNFILRLFASGYEFIIKINILEGR
jgi:hypothetical protein